MHNNAYVKAQNAPGDVKANVPKAGYADSRVSTPDMHNNSGVKAQNTSGDVKANVPKAGYPNAKHEAPATLKYAAGVKPLTGTGSSKTNVPNIKIEAKEAGSGKANLIVNKTDLI
jgi:hypothetical protein